MAQPIIMPKLGQMTEESTLVRWLKTEGDKVTKGEPLLEIETDKAVMEVESFYDGVLLKILVHEGETVPVMQTLAYVGAEGEEVDSAVTSQAVAPSPAPAADTLDAEEAPTAAGQSPQSAAEPQSG